VFYNNPIPNLTFFNIDVEFDIADRDLLLFDEMETQMSTSADISATFVDNGLYYGVNFDPTLNAGTPVELETNDLVGTIYFSICSDESVGIDFRNIQIADNMFTTYSLSAGDYSDGQFTFLDLIEIKGQVIEFAGLDGLSNALVDGNDLIQSNLKFNATDTTLTNGRFELVATAGSDYTVTVDVDGDQDGGDGCVNTFDVSRLTDHINGTDAFTEPGEFLSADVSGDGTVNTFDNIQINRVAMDVDSNAFTVNWIALPLGEYNSFSNPASNVPTVDGELDVSIASSTVTGQDFLAIKGGDTDKTCDDAIATLQVPNEKKLPINVPPLAFTVGEPVSLPVYGPDFQNAKVISFSLSVENEVIFTRISNGSLQMEDYHYHLRDGKIDVIWFTYNPEGIAVKSNEPLFYLEGVATRTIPDASQLIRMRNDRPYGNIIIEAGSSQYAELQLNRAQSGQNLKQYTELRAKSPSASTVQPNPFYSTFNINVVSTEKMDNRSIVRIFDNLTGTQVLERTITIHPGANTIAIDGLNNRPAGVYTYQIKIGQEIISGKVLKVQ